MNNYQTVENDDQATLLSGGLSRSRDWYTPTSALKIFPHKYCPRGWILTLGLCGKILAAFKLRCNIVHYKIGTEVIHSQIVHTLQKIKTPTLHTIDEGKSSECKVLRPQLRGNLVGRTDIGIYRIMKLYLRVTLVVASILTHTSLVSGGVLPTAVTCSSNCAACWKVNSPGVDTKFSCFEGYCGEVCPPDYHGLHCAKKQRC